MDGGDPELAVGCDAVALPRDDDSGLGTLSVVGFDAADPARTSVDGLAVDTDLAYFSADRMYVATAPGWWGGCCWVEDSVGDSVGPWVRTCCARPRPVVPAAPARSTSSPWTGSAPPTPPPVRSRAGSPTAGRWTSTTGCSG